jgi:hypothetical protein
MRNCSECDYYFASFCDLYEREADPFDVCDDFACMEDSDFLDHWEEGEDNGYPD